MPQETDRLHSALAGRTRRWASIATIASACLLLGSSCSDTVVLPTPRALFPKGNVQRGLRYAVFMTTGADTSTVTFGPSSLAFQPTDGVVYDSTSKKYQFMSLGTYTISVVGATPPLNSTITVVDAPTIVFDSGARTTRTSTLRR